MVVALSVGLVAAVLAIGTTLIGVVVLLLKYFGIIH